MRAIDADALREQFPEPKDWSDQEQALVHITGIWAEIDNAPTIELRCEECEAFNRTRLLVPQPERKKGKWHHCEGMYTCDQCGSSLDDISPFCPMCGSDMREDQDGKSD